VVVADHFGVQLIVVSRHEGGCQHNDDLATNYPNGSPLLDL
jgi:hypothetical protein